MAKAKDYPKNWKEISERIKERDGWKCQICGLQFSPTERKVKNKYGKYPVITVHHKDRNRKNNKNNNLITLCSRCHCQEEWPLIKREMHSKKINVHGQINFNWS